MESMEPRTGKADLVLEIDKLEDDDALRLF